MADALEKKIDLAEKTPPQKEEKVSDFKMPTTKRRFNWKLVFIPLGIIVFLAIFVGIFGVFPALKLKDDATRLMAEAQGISTSFQNQDLNGTIDKITSTKKELKNFSDDYQKLAWLKIVPLGSSYYQDGQHLLNGGNYLLEAGDIAVESIKPYADILGLKGSQETKSPEGMTAEKRLELMLDTLDKIQPNMDKISEKLELARKEVDQIDVNRYPEKIRGKNIRENVRLVKEGVNGSAKILTEIKPIVGYLKPLLGMPDEKRYLILFQNDAELRPTGGFITAYALISVKDGNFKPLGSFDIYGIDGRFGNRLKAPQPILDYHKNVPYWHLRDMNLSPDFKVSMDTFWENFRKVGPSDIHGIIAVDTQFLVDIIKVLGKVGVADWGEFSAENDKRCNCPQVVYELEKIADQPVGEIRTDRKAVLGPLMHSVLLNVMQSPRKKWPEFFNLVLNDIQEKHLLFYFFEEKLQTAMEALNAAGRIKDYDGDYLHLNDSNFAGAKSNLFIRENVEQKIEITSDGTVTKTITIDYRNPEKGSDCNLERGGLCLNGLYRDWVRLYVPKGSELIESTGSEIEVRTYEDLGKTVFEAFYGDKAPLRPEGKAQMTFKYKLPFKAQKGETYRLLIQKQPGTYGYEHVVKLDGKEESFELNMDKELRL